MKKMVVLIILSMLMVGCSVRSKSYYMIEGQKDTVQTNSLKERIGVKEILLPRYFSQNSLAIKEGENKIVFLPKSKWISNMDEHLSELLIRYLKRHFYTTDIYLYPWEGTKKLDKIVHIKIDDFIYHDKHIELDASWEIREYDGTKTAKFFHEIFPSSRDEDDIVKQMDKAFSALEVAIAKSLS